MQISRKITLFFQQNIKINKYQKQKKNEISNKVFLYLKKSSKHSIKKFD